MTGLRTMMSVGDFDLARLIWPVEPEAFFRDTWEKRPLALARTDRRYYAGLFAPHEVDALIYFTRPRFFGADDPRQPASPVVRGLDADGRSPSNPNEPGLLALRHMQAQGKTILVHSLQERSAAVAALCRSLEMTLCHPVHVNLYLTPRGTQGFGPHFDDCDVFIVQIDGFKHWRLYGPEQDLPLQGAHGDVPRERLTSPAQEVRLNSGDLLYLPRGHVHEAFTSQQASLHLTIGVEVFRWADLLASALACVSRQDVRFRQAVPPGLLGNSTAPEALRERFHEMLQLLADSAQLDGALANLAEQFINELRALPDGRFTQAPDAEHIDLDTVLDRRPGTICQVIDEGESVSVQFPGNRVRGPRQIAPALHFLAATAGGFTGRALPDNLSDNAKLILIRRLVREGLLTPRTPVASP
jgi:ribosomal protein L16 Arg81 hydroxylase